jgi:hypothetical protein
MTHQPQDQPHHPNQTRDPSAACMMGEQRRRGSAIDRMLLPF